MLPSTGHIQRILCVDDDPVSRRLLVAVLARPGRTVEIVNNGHEALERFTADARGFDVLVIDHCMPRMDGLELIRRLRKDGFTGVALVVTAYDSPKLRDDYGAFGVQTLLLKPVIPEALRQALPLPAAETAATRVISAFDQAFP